MDVHSKSTLHSTAPSSMCLAENLGHYITEAEETEVDADEIKLTFRNEDIERIQTMFSLKFDKIYGQTVPGSRIRVWKEIETGEKQYDCTCGGRRPSRSLTKIQDHAKGHDVKFRQCPHCTKQFTSHRSLNAHKRSHKEAIANAH
jgi:hypothetical protein